MDERFTLFIVKEQSWKWPFYQEIRENMARNDSLGQSDKNCHARVKRTQKMDTWDNNGASYTTAKAIGAVLLYVFCMFFDRLNTPR